MTLRISHVAGRLRMPLLHSRRKLGAAPDLCTAAWLGFAYPRYGRSRDKIATIAGLELLHDRVVRIVENNV